MNTIIGNIFALIASIIMVYSGALKQKKEILYTQTIQLVFFIISNIILGGITGAITNALSCIRNILCYKNKFNLKAKIILILLSTMLSLIFNQLGFIGLLPVVSTVVYTLLINTKNIIKLKSIIAFTSVMWLIYDIFIKSYTSAVFDFLSIVTSIISIFQIILKK